jgi:hypothetical protein
MFRNHIFYRINTYQLSAKKLFKLVPEMSQMPIVYAGYKSLDDYVINTSRLIICKNNVIQVSNDPMVHANIHHSFKQIHNDSSLCRILGRNDSKNIMVSYRISCFLMKK